MNMLVAIESPIRSVASSAAGTKSALFAPQASAMSACRSLPAAPVRVTDELRGRVRQSR
jgi:hypothetical protein